MSADNINEWYRKNNCTHAHCPDSCDKPQPMLLADGRLVCGRCLVKFGEVCEMVPCTPATCGRELALRVSDQVRRLEEAKRVSPETMRLEVTL